LEEWQFRGIEELLQETNTLLREILVELRKQTPPPETFAVATGATMVFATLGTSHS
jgi:hypothetical protein